MNVFQWVNGVLKWVVTSSGGVISLSGHFEAVMTKMIVWTWSWAVELNFKVELVRTASSMI